MSSTRQHTLSDHPHNGRPIISLEEVDTAHRVDDEAPHARCSSGFGCVCARTPGDRFIGTGAPSAGMPTPGGQNRDISVHVVAVDAHALAARQEPVDFRSPAERRAGSLGRLPQRRDGRGRVGAPLVRDTSASDPPWF